MTYANLHTATQFLADKLYRLNGHSIDAAHTSYAFDQLARALDYINRETAVVSVNFDAEAYLTGGHTTDIIVTVSGNSIDNPVDIRLEVKRV